MSRRKNLHGVVFQDEDLKRYQSFSDDFFARFQPQDNFEAEFVIQLLEELWQRARFHWFDLMNWQHAAARAGLNGASHLAASNHLEVATLQRSKAFGMAQDRHAQAFHRTLRSWTQCVARQKNAKTNEPK
jgi:hypothetical protein